MEAMAEQEPQLVTLAGPNGAGKSTLTRELSSRFGFSEFVNADTIAHGQIVTIPAEEIQVDDEPSG